MNALYVCERNIIRSPAAERITLKKAGSSIHVSSAGIHEAQYSEMADEMRTALRKKGYPTGPHVPRQLKKEFLSGQDFVFCMSKSQTAYVSSLVPNPDYMLCTLPAYAGFPDEEVEDPHDFIKDIPIFPAVEPLPLIARELIYRLCGCTDSRDKEAAIRLYVNTVRQLERYIDRALERMRGEGVIS